MVYFNYGRLKGISANIKESLNDLDEAIIFYNSLKDIKLFYESRKDNIIDILSELEGIIQNK